MVEPITGPYADNGQMAVDGAKLAVQQVNSSGGLKGVGGAKLKLDVQDTGDASTAQISNITQNAIQQDNPSALIGAWASSYSLAASTVAEQNKIPLLTESFADELVQRGYKYTFKLPASAELMGSQGVTAVLDLASQAHYAIKSAAMIADNTSSAEISAQSAATVLKSKGISVPVSDYFTPGLTSGQSIAIKVMATHPQLIYLNCDLSDTALIQQALHEQGYHGPFFGSGGGFVVDQYGSTLGSLSDGTFTTAGWNWDMPYPAAKQFVAAFSKQYPSVSFPTQEAGEDYTAVELIADAINSAKSSQPQQIRDALAKIDGTSGEASIMPGGTVKFSTAGENTGTPVILVQWLGGKPHTVYPANLAQSKAKFSF
jgi:branched-chain amino acid transport system substrate-binding protein